MRTRVKRNKTLRASTRKINLCKAPWVPLKTSELSQPSRQPEPTGNYTQRASELKRDNARKREKRRDTDIERNSFLTFFVTITNILTATTKMRYEKEKNIDPITYKKPPKKKETF